MKLAVFGPQRKVGLVWRDEVIDVCAAYARYLAETTDEPSPAEKAAAVVPCELGDFIAAGEGALAAAGELAGHWEQLSADHVTSDEPLSWPLGSVRLWPPLARRARIFAAGRNYAAHTVGMEGDGGPDDGDAVERARREIRADGLRGFISFVENCVGPDGSIIHPARTDMLDFEGEVAVVIGRECKDVAAAQAAEMFWGFVLLNDISARRATPVADSRGSRFARDKNFDTSKCAGPYVAVGEFADAQDIHWETRLNGELRQRGHTREMVFSFAEMVEHLSEDMTLFPGDVISGGTTSGTIMDSTPVVPGRGRDPGAFLAPGDVIELANPIIGTLRNAVVAKPSGPTGA